MNIHNLTCPGCHSPDHIENVANGEVWFYYKCNACSTKMLIDKETRDIHSYNLVTIYKEKVYEGCFYIKQSIFRLDCSPSPGDWSIVLRFNFLPSFDASNFAKKLPTLLTFY